jgi:hypothetical protein
MHFIYMTLIKFFFQNIKTKQKIDISQIEIKVFINVLFKKSNIYI